MNKQEVINEIEKIDYQNLKYDSPERMLSAQKQLIIDIIDKLDEPQKVKVPAFMKDFFDFCIENEQNGAEAYHGLFDICSSWPKDDILKWSFDDPYRFINVFQYGYEVEEEPKWVVKVGNLYFCGWEDTTAQFVMNTVLGEDESIIKYKNEGTASSVAKNLGGTVEKV